MSSSSRKGKELSTKEDKIITSALFLLLDKKLKLDAANELNKVRSTIEGLELDDKMNLDFIQSTSSVSSAIKQSHEENKSHVKRVDFSSNKTETASE